MDATLKKVLKLIDPSEAVENFPHRGNFKASRKSSEFEGIVPMNPADLPQASPESTDFRDFLTTIRQVRAELGAEIEKLSSQPGTTASTAAQPL